MYIPPTSHSKLAPIVMKKFGSNVQHANGNLHIERVLGDDYTSRLNFLLLQGPIRSNGLLVLSTRWREDLMPEQKGQSLTLDGESDKTIGSVG